MNCRKFVRPNCLPQLSDQVRKNLIDNSKGLPIKFSLDETGKDH